MEEVTYEEWKAGLDKLNDTLETFCKNQTKMCEELEKAVIILNRINNE